MSGQKRSVAADTSVNQTPQSGKKSKPSTTNAASTSHPSNQSSASASSAAAAESTSDADEPFVRPLLSYEAWKETLPVLYDCFMHSNLEWPSYACAWGPVIPEVPTLTKEAAQAAAAAQAQAASSGAAATAPPIPPHLTQDSLIPQTYDTSYVTQNFYFSRSTDSKLERDKWIGSPNMLLKAEIYYPNQYRVQDISKMKNFDEDQRNPALVLRKKIVHPGEINRIKLVPQFPDLIATHTDSPLVYIWNTNTQPTRRSQLNTDPSIPDLTLQGHREREDCNTLYYALDCSNHQPLVISGGSDQKICLWDISDYCSTLLTTAHVSKSATGTPSSLSKLPSPSKKHIDRLLEPRTIFSGHTAQVEEVCFHPNTPNLLCSVGDDRFLMVWDVRAGGARPVLKIHTTHEDDVNAVHWNTVNDNLLVTGSSDHTVKLIDLRRVTRTDSSFQSGYATNPGHCRSHVSNKRSSASVIETFHGHTRGVTNVQWHSNGEYFASGCDDGDLCVWSIKGVESLQEPYPKHNNMGPDSTDSITSTQSLTNGLPPAPLWDGSLDSQPKHLFFRHTGHRTAVVNFAWNPFVKDGWNVASLSDDSADASLVGGGRLHVWRITDLLTNPYEKIAQEFAASKPGQTQPQQTTNNTTTAPTLNNQSNGPTSANQTTTTSQTTINTSITHGTAAASTTMEDTTNESHLHEPAAADDGAIPMVIDQE